MITIKTKTTISLQQAIEFEISQNEKNIRKLGMFSIEPCHWLLKVENPNLDNGFKADVTWYQLQTYKPDSDSEETAIKEEKMFFENFSLSKIELDLLFAKINEPILTDKFSESFEKVISEGVIFWLEEIGRVFGYSNEFEII